MRDATRQAAIRAGGMVQDALVLDLIQGHTVIESLFGTGLGTRLELENSAHGKSCVAPGADRADLRGLRAATDDREVDGTLAAEIAKTRKRGWGRPRPSRSSTASMRWQRRCSTIPAHHRLDRRRPAIESIAPEPNRKQIDAVVGAAQRISSALGWRRHSS